MSSAQNIHIDYSLPLSAVFALRFPALHLRRSNLMLGFYPQMSLLSGIVTIWCVYNPFFSFSFLTNFSAGLQSSSFSQPKLLKWSSPSCGIQSSSLDSRISTFLGSRPTAFTFRKESSASTFWKFRSRNRSGSAYQEASTFFFREEGKFPSFFLLSFLISYFNLPFCFRHRQLSQKRLPKTVLTMPLKMTKKRTIPANPKWMS